MLYILIIHFVFVFESNTIINTRFESYLKHIFNYLVILLQSSSDSEMGEVNTYPYTDLITDLNNRPLPERWCCKLFPNRIVLYYIDENNVTTTVIIDKDYFVIIHKEDCIGDFYIDPESFSAFCITIINLQKMIICRGIYPLNRRCFDWQQNELARTNEIDQRKNFSFQMKRDMTRVRPLLKSIQRKILKMQNVYQMLLQDHTFAAAATNNNKIKT
ncbi:uncharacterized protein LOC105285001 isoform X2 [Ooceraea biroi]|uniref:uncharacterized protein LOC105285001 isoform X2 n=1 Tax=Ooceraea biroi TaxID=2015173 RepID=UPI0005BE00B8|nr:uncharacterized protein LOC105285001 isoform X2 [Ooceraea biroi]